MPSLSLLLEPLQMRFEEDPLVVVLKVLLTRGCWNTPWVTMVARGRRLGIQAQTTAMLGSNADQIPALMKFPRTVSISRLTKRRKW